jgi:8-oxo-dGTP diphosphatase
MSATLPDRDGRATPEGKTALRAARSLELWDAAAMSGLVDRQRVAAYGVAIRDGCILLARASRSSDFPGAWSLPGGGVDHGEHPQQSVIREFLEETGLIVSVDGEWAVFSDVADIASKGIRLHHVRLCYPVTVTGGTLRNEFQGTTDLAQWVRFGEALDLSPIAPFVTAAIEAAVQGRPLAGGDW